MNSVPDPLQILGSKCHCPANFRVASRKCGAVPPHRCWVRARRTIWQECRGNGKTCAALRPGRAIPQGSMGGVARFSLQVHKCSLSTAAGNFPSTVGRKLLFSAKSECAREKTGGLCEARSWSIKEPAEGLAARTSGRRAETENGHYIGAKRKIRPTSHRRSGRAGALVPPRSESGKPAKIP